MRHNRFNRLPPMPPERQEVITRSKEAAAFYQSVANPVQAFQTGVEAFTHSYLSDRTMEEALLKDGGATYTHIVDVLCDRYFSEINNRLLSPGSAFVMAQTVTLPKGLSGSKIGATVCAEETKMGRVCGKIIDQSVIMRATPESRAFYFASDTPGSETITTPLSLFRRGEVEMKGRLFTGLQIHTLLEHADTAWPQDLNSIANDMLEFRDVQRVFQGANVPLCDLFVPFDEAMVKGALKLAE